MEWSATLWFHQSGPQRTGCCRHPQVCLPRPGDSAWILGQSSAWAAGIEGQCVVILGWPPWESFLQHQWRRANPLPLWSQHRMPSLGHHRYLRHHSGSHTARYAFFFYVVNSLCGDTLNLNPRCQLGCHLFWPWLWQPWSHRNLFL